jgi:peptidoglycan/xylan/chitin deacetylase (PgdA/CDA1 family)
MLPVLRAIAKDAFFMLNGSPLGERASILSYHDVGTNKAFFTVTPASLDKQLSYLKSQGLKVVFLSELIKKLKAKEDISGLVALTFNDGYASVYTEVLPLLKKYEMPASVFLTIEYLDTTVQTSDGFTFKTLSQAQLREMLAGGLVEFFPETQHRVALDNVAYEGAAMKIDQARADLESVIKKDAKVFSFPKGRHTQKLLEHLASHDWLGAVTTREGLVSRDSNPYALPRNSVDSKTSFTQFKGKVSGAIEKYVHTRN